MTSISKMSTENIYAAVQQFADAHARRHPIRRHPVINSSRMESLGRAAVEVAGLGVPLLSRRTGIIEQAIDRPEFLFSPNKPAEPAPALRNLIQDWPRLNFDAVSGSLLPGKNNFTP